MGTEDSGSPFYRSIDHRTPGNRDDLVLCCLFVNEMKCDLNEDEFKEIVCALADTFSSGAVTNLGTVQFKHRRRNWLGTK